MAAIFEAISAKSPCENPDDGSCPFLDLQRVCKAAIIAAAGDIAYDLGVALAGGEPLTAEVFLGDIVTGAIGGAVGEVVLQVTCDELLAAIVGALITGILFQGLFPPAPVAF